MSEELKPCPFCGGDPSISTYETESLWSHEQVTYTKVECTECDIMFHSEPGYEVEAPEAWNRRSAPSQARLSEAVKMLEEAREHIETLSELLKVIKESWIDYDHVFSIAVHEADQWIETKAKPLLASE